MKTLIRVLAVTVILALVLPAAFAEEPADWTDEEWKQINAFLNEGGDKEIPLLDKFRVTVSPDDLDPVEGLSGEWLNILLLGTDSHFSKALNSGSSDLTMIASINIGTGEIRLTSLVREIYVDIPGLSRPNRINVTNAFGGPLLAVKTVNSVFTMNITKYCTVNFRGFEEVIDMLGGVELTLTIAEAKACGAKMTTAPQVLDGKTALSYARIHTVLGGNIAAADRNMNVLLSILKKMKSGIPLQDILSTIFTALGWMDTNLTAADIIRLATMIFKNPNLTMETLRLPQDGHWNYMTSPWGQSVVEFDKEAAVKALYEFIYE